LDASPGDEQVQLTDEQLLRYSRQLMLDGFDLDGQVALLQSSVLIVGLGGLGCPAAMYLASSGVGRLLLADDDRVELSNLQRQIAHTTADIGDAKVDSVAATLRALNPDVEVQAMAARLEGTMLQQTIAGVDLVLDASDNFATRFAINAACVAHAVPLVSAAAIRSEAQIAVFDTRRPESPCYRCLYSDDAEQDLSCAQSGVIAPLVGIVGAAQALEAVKLLSAYGDALVGRLLMFDAKTMEWRELGLSRKADCPVCSSRFGAL
jgi:molybdopterin/thiamine biosynthesis adenylyltransferase